MKYQIEVRESLARILVVEAPDEDSAVARVEEAYNNDEIILGPEDIMGEAEVEALEDSVSDDFEVDYTVEETIVKYCLSCHLKQSRTNEVCEKCGCEISEGLNIK